MEIIFSDEFKKDFKKIKNKSLLLNLLKHIQKLSEFPESGKPLKYELKNHRSIRIKPFRIIYRLEKSFRGRKIFK
jgi:addiction module RelE/StbE family toxin